MQSVSAPPCCPATRYLARQRSGHIEKLISPYRHTRTHVHTQSSCCSSTIEPRKADTYFNRLSEAVCIIAVACSIAGASFAAEPAEVFQRSGCIGCHAGGGNIVQAGASLQTNDLQKNGAATTDAIYKLIYSGKGKMPGYGKDCTPRGKCTFGPRLPAEDIQRLSQYVLDQAAVKWK